MISPRYILAPYVPTPPEVVARMIELADVRPADIVFDLGCGDGRLVIAAARDRGAHGVGIDIETHWVERARANAVLAGVSHLTRFEQEDALAADLTSASVVFLYLVEWSTRLVLPRVLSQVADGTRLVSHSFAFERAAEATASFADANGQVRSLHLRVAGSS